MKFALLAIPLTIAATFVQAAPNNVVLTTPIGGATAVHGDGAPGFGDGSWQANGTSKSEVYISAAELFSTPFTIGQIDSMSYWTKKSDGPGAVDWTLYIYTAKTGSGDSGSWYGSRLNSEPYLAAGNTGALAGQWNKWTTDPTAPNDINRLRFYDQPRGGTFGTYADPFLAALTAGSITWGNGASHDYSLETVRYISFQTGSSWANGFTGQLDGFTILLKNGNSATVNFATPEPGTAALLALPLLALGYLRRRRG